MMVNDWIDSHHFNEVNLKKIIKNLKEKTSKLQEALRLVFLMMDELKKQIPRHQSKMLYFLLQINHTNHN